MSSGDDLPSLRPYLFIHKNSLRIAQIFCQLWNRGQNGTFRRVLLPIGTY